nr:bacterio-opsin activator domain-containing protein [Halomarina rubra]
MSDTVLEVELQTSEHVPALIEEVGEDGRVTFERTIPTGDDYLQYVQVENISPERFETILERYPWCDGVRRIRDGDPAVYELRAVRPSITAHLATFGGRVRSAVVEDGAIRILAELPHNTDVRALVDGLRERREDIELVAQRTVPRSDHPDRARVSVEETLSDRQQATLEVAYYAGYFEWPRDSTAEEIAESLGVSSPTVHKHLRRAQGSIFGALLDRPDM